MIDNSYDNFTSFSSSKHKSPSLLQFISNSLTGRHKCIIIVLFTLIIIQSILVFFFLRNNSNTPQPIMKEQQEHQPPSLNDVTNLNENSLLSLSQSLEQFKEDEKYSKYEILYGLHSCNKYYKYDATPMNTLHTMCKIQNLCLNKKGQFILFTNQNKNIKPLNIYNNYPLTYTQGRVETNRGDFYVKHIEGDLIIQNANPIIKNFNDKNIFNKRREKAKELQTNFKMIEKATIRVSNNIDNNNNQKCSLEDSFYNTKKCETNGYTFLPIKLSPNFTVIKEPTFALHRYAAGNVGHILMENVNMIVSLMLGFNEITLNNHILFLEDVYDDSIQNNWISHYNYNKDNTDRYSIQTFSLLSKYNILQKCRNQDQSYFITKAPCRNVKPKEEEEIKKKQIKEEEEEEELEVCFEQFYVGYSLNNFLKGYGREILYPTIRSLAYTKLNIPMFLKNSKEEFNYFLKKDILISIHLKPLQSRHGNVIWNANIIQNYLQEKLMKEKFIIELLKNRKLKIDLLKLEGMTIADQINYFSNVDYYLVDQGSAAYMSMFLRPETLVVQSPRCNAYQIEKEFQKKCETGYTYVISPFPDILIYNVLDLIDEGKVIDCKIRPLEKEPTNCDPILPIDVIYQSVLTQIQRRYHKYI
ncbi:hypothetical protein ABK040_006095 [Willaertia magna]